jgi:serine/threonine protein kinase
MNIVRIQGEAEKRNGIYYELDIDGPFLGEGGMGRVYKGFCVDMRTGQRSVVAIKAVHESIQSPQLLERARREASVQIDNENLMKMYGFIENHEQLLSGAWVQRYYMPMEFLVGVNLEDMLRGITTDQNGLRIPFAEELYAYFQNDKVSAIAHVAKAILAGIMALHNKGFIHRDIDPSNVMITIDHKIKLIDFGICKQINTLATLDKHLTSSGTFIGKVNYAAPELVLGDVKSQNQTTDIYAIGVLLYQLYTGKLPFEGSDEHVLYCHLRKPMPIKDIKHPQLKKIIKKATEKSQEKRYASAAEMIVDLERLLNRTSRGEKVEVRKDGGKAKGIIITGVAAVAAVAAAFVFWPKEPSLPPPPPPTASELYSMALAKVAPGQPDSLVIEGKLMLRNLAKDSLYTEAIMTHYHHVLSDKDTLQWKDAYALVERLAVRDSLPEAMYQCGMVKSYHSEKQNLPEFEIYHFANDQDLLTAANWFEAVVEKDSTNYKARIYALMNYVQMKDPATYGDVMRQHYANYLLITQNLPEEEKQVYAKTLEVLRKRLFAWGLVN